VKYWAALALLSSTLWAQQNTVIQTETRVVLVDTIVTGKKGEYIRDLNAKDFRVWEDNKEQTIRSLSLESASSANAQPRYLVLFFDNAAIEAADQFRVQQAVSQFIDANAGPNRMMAVVNYNGSLQVAQKFSDNAGRLKDAIKAVSTTSGARGVPSAAADLRARDMLRAIAALSKGLTALPGRKIVVLLTEGLAPTNDQRISAKAAIEAANMSGVALYPIDVQPLASAKLESESQGGRTQNSRGASTYSRGRGGGPQAGPQELAADQAADSRANAQTSVAQEILFTLANGTGGFVIQDSSALLGGLQEIGEEQNEFYVLSYTPPESKDGTCHTLRVKVDRRGTSVRARSNYCTVKPLDLLADNSAGRELENRVTGPQTGNLAASMELPFFYSAPGMARVNVAMEIMPGELKLENQKGKLHAEIKLLGQASTPDGGVAARFSDALNFDFDNQAQADSWKAKPVHYEKEFKIAPGKYTFTMVFGSGETNFGKLEMPLAVDAWNTGELALSGLVLSHELRPADQGLGLDSLTGDRTPLIADGMQMIPSGSNQFVKSEPAFLYFEAYTPDSAPVVGHLRILDRKTGVQKWDSGPMRLTARQAGPIPIASLAAGSYVLEVSAENAAHKVLKRVVDFEVK
jgi:VWFA-related protein